MRYIDDLLVFIAYDKKDTQTKNLATKIYDHITKDTYHKFMKLKTEDTTQHFSFLEVILSIKQTNESHDVIEIEYNNKNLPYLLETKKLRYHTMQHRGSFITTQQAHAKLIGQLYRIQRTTATIENLKNAVLEFALIAYHLRYTHNESLFTITKMTMKHEFWFNSYSFLKK